MTKVKICGITNLKDALLSAKFGADALGFNFYEKSPRYILPEVAKEIIDELPENILKVGVFVNEEQDSIIEIAKVANLDAIQLHGEETPEFASELKTKTGLEIIKAFRVSKDFKPEDVLQFKVDAILLDAYSPKEHGGTGETFNWGYAMKVKEIFPKMYLAGGLSQDNVAHAILEVSPFAVDACSNLESAKGTKNKVKIINFISNCSYANHELGQESFHKKLRSFHAENKILLPKKSLTLLCSYLFGYYSAKGKNSDFYSSENLLRRFNNWLNSKYILGYFTQTVFVFSSHYLEKTNMDEERAFDLFFAELEEFLLEKDLRNE